MSVRVFFLLLISFFQHVKFGGSFDVFPDTIIPEHYDIRILTLMDELKFDGSVDILVQCEKSTDEIILHASNFVIHKENITMKEAESLEEKPILRINFTGEDGLLMIYLGEHLSTNVKYIIHIEYQGELGQEPYGFYSVIYEDEKNINHTVANTFFEPLWARRAFPCFDLPHMKSTFEVTLGRHEKFFTLNNMPLKNSEPIEGRSGWFWDHFEKTLPMSTYLVAFAVLDDGIKNISSGKISIWYPPLANVTTFLLEKTEEMFDYLQNYFGIEYELPKLDFLVVENIPSFAGASECWGLIIVDAYVLQEKYLSLTTFGHEMIHHWYGNIATMKCFGELWLKEGPTVYFTTMVKDVVTVGETLDLDIASDFFYTMGNHLTKELSTTICLEELDNVLDFYMYNTYSKGSLFMRMIKMSFGLEGFQKTSNSLLTKYRFRNFDEKDFWNALKETTPAENIPRELDIDVILNSWTRQDGYPIVFISRNYENESAGLTQRKFYYIDSTDEMTRCWWIPISYMTKSYIHNNTVAQIWMRCPNRTESINDLKSSDWILANLQSTGFFIVKYDDTNWKLLSDTLRDEKSFEIIPYWNRFRLILDSLYLTDFGLSSHESLLVALLYLKHETRAVVWQAALKYFSKINWLDEEIVNLKKEYMRILVQPHFSTRLFDLDKTTLEERTFNVLIIKEACSCGIQECIDEYLSLFAAFKNSFPKEYSLNADIREDIFCFNLRVGPEENRQFLIDIIPLISNNSLLLMQVYNSLTSPACSKTPLTEAQQKGLPIVKNVRTKPQQVMRTLFRQNDFSLFEKLLTSPGIQKLLEQSYSSWGLVDQIRLIADHIHDPKELNWLRKFFEDNQKEYSRHKKTTDEILRKIERNIKWKKNYAAEIKMALLKILGKSNGTIEPILATEPSETTKVPVKKAEVDESSASVAQIMKESVLFSIVIYIIYF